MFKVYHGLTFGEGFEPDAEFGCPDEALADALAHQTAAVVLQQTDTTFTLMYIVRDKKVFNCLSGKLS